MLSFQVEIKAFINDCERCTVFPGKIAYLYIEYEQITRRLPHKSVLNGACLTCEENHRHDSDFSEGPCYQQLTFAVSWCLLGHAAEGNGALICFKVGIINGRKTYSSKIYISKFYIYMKMSSTSAFRDSCQEKKETEI